MKIRAISTALRHFRRREDGMMAIEFVVMVPLFVAMVSGVVDLSRVYVDQANYYSVARDTARIVSRHGMTEDSAESYAVARIAELSNAAAQVEVEKGNSDVSVTINAPISAMAKFGFLSFLQNSQLTATVVYELEPV
ncbi:TadE/TadG family type IV pilus assembly protein [Tropicimonas aquimaris]|uniref:TadE/TadG family type IV pilus assembly protein n=1 Tax=Tropicimonas aquimaris TaxID=914152 RepID=A0ABW3IMQ7_9RHOB